jgi:hypothetical protein
MKFNDIPVILRKKTGSDFVAGAIVTLSTGLIFMGIIKFLMIVIPTK